MTTAIAYRNGQFLPASEVSISLEDAGFVWGATIADRVRTFNGQLFRVAEHLDRFRGSCWTSRVPLSESDSQLVALSERLVHVNRGTGEVSVVWLATPGPVRQSAGSRPTLIAHTVPIDPDRAARLNNEGVSLATVTTMGSIGADAKHRSRLSWWVANEKLKDIYPGAQPLFVQFDSDEVHETPTSNVLVVQDGEVVSPHDQVLEGVSLGVVGDLCAKIGIGFTRRHVKSDDLKSASEVLLTNTTDCVVGVSSLNGQPVPFPGPVLRQLQDAWSSLVGMDIRQT
jgi:branched-subunit amino acid aminotransferase/4-amino-4-deoxychorismate lyase